MAISLLMGNGINRLNNDGVSWEELLNNLMTGLSLGKQIKYLKQKPFALVYEEILLSRTPAKNGSLRRQLLEEEVAIKTLIAEQAKKLQHNDYHTRVMNSGVKHILTTNYDYSFENAAVANKSGAKNNLPSELKYSVFRRKKHGAQSVWHIHGEADVANSITLGYDQYSGYIQQLRGYATADRRKRGYASPFKAGDMRFDRNPEKVHSWIDVFLRDDIHIVGLSLDYTEIDLWWALTYKERLRARNFPVGLTYYHEWHTSTLKDDVLGKLSMLKALNVRVRKQDCSTGFADAYDTFLKERLGA